MRSGALLAALLLGSAGCPSGDPVNAQCTVSKNCAAGEICVDGSCIPDPAGPLPVGEGEAGEGEGDTPGEGEGDKPGEGEGDAGEGEGDAGGEGEGEGEGDAGGEGEGEGDVSPVCTANGGCGALQSCTANNVCTNDAGSVVCDSIPSSTIDFFADQNDIALDNVSGDRFFFDGKDRFNIRRVTAGMRPGMVVDVKVTSPIDTMIYLMDDATGQCTESAVVDQFVGTEEFLMTVPAQDIDMVVTSFDAIPAAGSTGAVSIRTRGILCDTGNAAGDETDTQTTYDQCFRALFERATSLTCDDNPCARNASDATTGKFCTLQTTSGHVNGTNITLKNDVPGGPCCGTSAGCPGANCPANCQ